MKTFVLWFLFIVGLAICLSLMGCLLSPAPTGESKDMLYLTVDSMGLPMFERRLTQEPSPEVLAKWIASAIVDGASEQGIPSSMVVVHNVKYNVGNYWIATVSIEGISAFETLDCIAKTLIKIPFVRMVEGKEIKYRK